MKRQEVKCSSSTIPRHDKVHMEVLFQTFEMRINRTSEFYNNKSSETYSDSPLT